MKKLAFALMLALSSTLLPGCHAADEKLGLDAVGYKLVAVPPYTTLMLALSSSVLSSRHAVDEKLGLSVVGYNHTDHDVGHFSVNGQAGAFVARHDQSGFACCVSILRKYPPGMTVTVTWSDEYGENPQSRVVAVPPYTSKDTGLFSVHFLRSGHIKVFVTSVGVISSPDYPLKGDEAKL